MKKTFNLAPDFDQKVQKRQKTATLIFDFFLGPSALEKKYQNTTSYHFLPLRSADPACSFRSTTGKNQSIAGIT